MATSRSPTDRRPDDGCNTVAGAGGTVNGISSEVFCLVDAPDRETATRVHREAHGLEAHTLYKVTQGA